MIKSIDAIPLADALADIATYKKYMKDTFDIDEKNILKAFLLHSIEILEVLRIPVVDFHKPFIGVRVYLGMKTGGLPTDFKLFLTPVDKEGNDIIFNGVFNPQLAAGDYVYDFTMPCPKTCDTSSPLYNA